MNIAIILSGGIGSRMKQNCPKQYIKVDDKPIVYYSIQAFTTREDIDAIVVVSSIEWQSYVLKLVEGMNFSKEVYWACAGTSRQESIYNALLECEKFFSDNDIIIIHDGARPLVTEELITNCIKECQYSDGVLPVIPIKDTIYQSNDGKKIDSLLDRNILFAGQSPESFRLGKYLKIHKNICKEEIAGIKGSSEIAYRYGLDIKLISGDEKNFKITTQNDLQRFKDIVLSTYEG